ncbi:holo-ACP synthase [Vibrio sp. RC27]
MAIVGIGTDIVEIERIQEAINKSGDKLAQRILTEEELAEYNFHHHPERFLAKRFSAKEAASKALGTGIAQGVSFQDFSILNDQLGKPKLTMTGRAEQISQLIGGKTMHVSISDEKHYATATVIIES